MEGDLNTLSKGNSFAAKGTIALYPKKAGTTVLTFTFNDLVTKESRNYSVKIKVVNLKKAAFKSIKNGKTVKKASFSLTSKMLENYGSMTIYVKNTKTKKTFAHVICP